MNQADYIAIRSKTEEICAPLKVEDYIPQPAAFVSPPKWHLGHTTWFFETFLLSAFNQDYKPFDARFGYLFNSYYNTLGDRTQRDQRGAMSRPVLAEVFDYRHYVDEAMVELISSLDALNNKDLASLLAIGLNHEQQHQELLWTDLKYILGNNPLFPAYAERVRLEATKKHSNDWMSFPAGLYDIGHDGVGFGYDNEFKRHKVYLQSYAIQDGLVSNEAFLEFLMDDGYVRHELWLDEGWAWLASSGVKAPLHWHLIDGQWMEYRLDGLHPMDPAQAVCHVSHYEAAAFAEWKGLRLPTETEWESASDHFEWGERWEHTNSAYLAYPGFQRPEGAVGEYNGKFMMNQMVLRGASMATAKGHSRKTYRNFFHPNMQWQFSGIRLAKHE
ncbi:MAG: ergothioneine biosynthesis protein EgtB [Flavobacteriales bacterium]|nr:ergothioneine biosynthesis protein EgtB [Flavobacteriales bacterium]